MDKWLALLNLSLVIFLPTTVLPFCIDFRSSKDAAERRGEPFRAWQVFLRHGVIACCIQGFLWGFLFSSLVGSVAKNKARCAAANAKMICNTARYYLEEHPGATLETCIFHTTAPAPEDSFEAFAQKYLPDGDYWYAVECTENGRLVRTYWSKREITPADLYPRTQEELYHIYYSPFCNEDDAVGSWEP